MFGFRKNRKAQGTAQVVPVTSQELETPVQPKEPVQPTAFFNKDQRYYLVLKSSNKDSNGVATRAKLVYHSPNLLTPKSFDVRKTWVDGSYRFVYGNSKVRVNDDPILEELIYNLVIDNFTLFVAEPNKYVAEATINYQPPCRQVDFSGGLPKWKSEYMGNGLGYLHKISCRSDINPNDLFILHDVQKVDYGFYCSYYGFTTKTKEYLNYILDPNSGANRGAYYLYWESFHCREVLRNEVNWTWNYIDFIHDLCALPENKVMVFTTAHEGQAFKYAYLDRKV